MSSPLPSNMALCTVRGRYGTWTSTEPETTPQFVPFQGLNVRFAPAYPFVTNTTATPDPIVVATAPRIFVTDAEGYLSDPADGFDIDGLGNNRNCQLVASDDSDIWPNDWKYLVTFTGTGATNFRSFRTPAPSGAIVDMAVLTPQRTSGTPTTQAELAAAHAAASAFQAEQALMNMNKGQAGGVAALDEDGDVNNASGDKILGGGGGGGGSTALADITGMSVNGKALVATLIGGVASTPALMRGVIGAGTGNSNLVIGTTSGTAADAALTNTALGLRALDSAVVHDTGDETIDGSKTFLDPIVIPDGTSADQAVNKAQLDIVQGLAVAIPTAAQVGAIATSQKGVINGVAALNSSGQVVDSSGTPVTGGGGSLPPNGATGLALFATATPAEARNVIVLDQVNNTSDANKPLSTAMVAALLQKVDVTALATALNNVIATSQKGVANGVATLDGSGKIPYSQLPQGVLLGARQNVDGSWPGRPVATNTVVWIGGEIAPGGGSFTSGTGMVDGVDVQALGPG